MKQSYEVTFERVHFRTSLLKYSDAAGSTEAYFEQSAVPEYDWIGDEPSFALEPGRLADVLKNVHEWAAEQGMILKIWKQDELGI